MKFLDRAEQIYISLLRGAILILATLMLAYTAWLALPGIYNTLRDASSVKEKPVAVDADEVANIDLSSSKSTSIDRATSKAPSYVAEKTFYANSLGMYFDIYKSSFEAYRKASDSALSKEEFDRRFFNSRERIAALGSAEFDFDQDKAEISGLIKAMSDLANIPKTKARLEAYKVAKLTPVIQKVKKVRYERYCEYYSYSGPCLIYDTRPISYTETSTVMKLPDGVVSHTDLFSAYQKKYIEMLNQRRSMSKLEAENKRSDIIAGNIKGQEDLATAVKMGGGFLVLMFFFLLIAIERHQRKIANDLQANGPQRRMDALLPEGPELV